VRSYRVVPKRIHTTANLDIKEEIEDLEHIINIWNIKKQGTKKILHIFCKLQSKSNNKNIYEIGLLPEFRAKFEPP